jgi:hypothetical protein
LLTGAFSLTAAGKITDSLGDSGILAVTNGLLGSLTVNDGTFGFSNPYSFTVTVPGTDSQSLLFVHDSTLAAASSVPEPSTWILLVSGCAIVAFARRRVLWPGRARSRGVAVAVAGCVAVVVALVGTPPARAGSILLTPEWVEKYGSATGDGRLTANESPSPRRSEPGEANPCRWLRFPGSRVDHSQELPSGRGWAGSHRERVRR